MNLKHVKHVLGIFQLIAILFLNISQSAETAKVLPKGIFRLRAVGVVSERVDEKFNNEGTIEPLTGALNRSITINDLTVQSKDLGRLQSAVKKLDPEAAQSLSNINIYTEGSVKVSSVLGAIEYGISDRVSFGVRAPVVFRNIRSGFNAESINNAGTAANRLGGLIKNTSLEAGLKDLSNKSFDTAFFEDALFTSKGYEVPHSLEKTNLGDTEFGAKYNFYKTDRLYLTTLIGGRAPTGSNPSLTNLLDSGTGNGNWGAGLHGYQTFEALSWLSIGSAQKLTLSFDDTRVRAVPLSEDDTLPNVQPGSPQVREVTRAQPIKYEGEISTTFYPFGPAFSIWDAYQYRSKGQDTFSGPGEKRYDLLARGTDYVTHYAELGIGYSTIPAFRAKRFSMPMEVQALFNTPLSGKNSNLMNYGRVDLIVYF